MIWMKIISLSIEDKCLFDFVIKKTKTNDIHQRS